MADVADRLRSAREEAGLSIEELSARTKIKPAQLLALERGSYDQLPGPFFARAFLRTYARELHLPVAEVMAGYEQAVTPAPSETVPERPHAVAHHSGSDFQDRPGSTQLWSALALTAVVIVGLYAMNRPELPRAAEPGAVGTSGTVTEAAAPAAASPAPQIPAGPETLTVDIRPIRPVWVTAHADDERVLYRLVEAEERITLEARDRLSFRVGDAGAFAFSLNGATGRSPGRDGEVREFTITRDNARSFLR